MSKAVGALLAERIEIPITYVDIFFIVDLYAEFFFSHRLVLSRQIGKVMGRGIIIVIQRPCIRQFTGGTTAPVKDLHEGIPCAHASKSGIQNGIDSVFLDPAHFNRVSCVEDRNDPGKCTANLTDHCPFFICQIIAAFYGTIIQKFSGAASNQNQCCIFFLLGPDKNFICRAYILQAGIQFRYFLV